MLIAPIYVRVDDGARGLRFAATSHADSMQLVRVWAVEQPQGLHRVAEFQQFELWPRVRELAAKHVPPVGECSYWLAILAFHKGGSAWERSASRHGGPFNVPEVGLAFDNEVALSVVYA